MINETRSPGAAPLADILALLARARTLLAEAEAGWPEALAREAAGRPLPEAAPLEHLLHLASHETASTLAFAIADIQTLIARIHLRQRYRMFGVELFEFIVSSGWSTTLAAELQRKMPEFSLGELSDLVKNLCTEWARLPQVAALTAPAKGSAAP